MKYSELFQVLKERFNHENIEIHLPGNRIKILNLTFTSHNGNILPGSKDHVCIQHHSKFQENGNLRNTINKTNVINPEYHNSIHISDCDIFSNNMFRYPIFMPEKQDRSDGVIILLHGLNERNWEKYLPWAYRLSEWTGKAVILFPIAFHMNRAPEEWGDPRLMWGVSKQRQKQYQTIAQSSFANAAISSRIQMSPSRFFWSGRQTYSDILQLIRQIKKGNHPHIASNANIDFFAYSIGAFLSEILIMTDIDHLIEQSRLFIFCGGPTLDRTYPVSRFILDSEANIALYSFFIEHLENECRIDDRLNHYFNDHRSGLYFQSMISLHRHRKIREERLKEIGPRIKAVSLQKDVVIPPVEVLNTLKGDYRDLPPEVQVIDFPFDYTHVNPFPVQEIHKEKVNQAFDQVFELAADQLTSRNR